MNYLHHHYPNNFVLFRYRLLAEEGGIWSDMDVVALADDPAIEAVPLVASEKRRVITSYSIHYTKLYDGLVRALLHLGHAGSKLDTPGLRDIARGRRDRS